MLSIARANHAIYNHFSLYNQRQQHKRALAKNAFQFPQHPQYKDRFGKQSFGSDILCSFSLLIIRTRWRIPTITPTYQPLPRFHFPSLITEVFRLRKWLSTSLCIVRLVLSSLTLFQQKLRKLDSTRGKESARGEKKRYGKQSLLRDATPSLISFIVSERNGTRGSCSSHQRGTSIRASRYKFAAEFQRKDFLEILACIKSQKYFFHSVISVWKRFFVSL